VEQDTSQLYHYDSASQEIVLELLGLSPDEQREVEGAPTLPCVEHIALQPIVIAGDSHEAEAVAGDAGFGAVIDRRLPLGPGFMEISLSDTEWFADTV
jgi:hypothetical protein